MITKKRENRRSLILVKETVTDPMGVSGWEAGRKKGPRKKGKKKVSSKKK